MKKTILLLALFSIIGFKSNAQDSCITAIPLCTGIVYNFDSSTGIGAPSGPYYGCLGAVLNPLWFSIHVTSAGSVNVSGAGTYFSGGAVDVDFIYWGPFSSLSGICYDQLDSAHVLGCDYSGDNVINVNIPYAASETYYIGMVSNYSDTTANISLAHSGGTATVSCITTCLFSELTATASVCNPDDGTYSVSGTISFTNAPATGTLTLFGSCDGSQTFTAPFNSPVEYTLTGLHANGTSCIIAAGFSDDVTCGITKNYTSPPPCNFDGMNEKDVVIGITILPNPTSGLFELDVESPIQDMSILISDVSGRTVYKETVAKFTGSYKKQIELSLFSKGVYFIKVQGDKSYFVKKIIYN